MAPFKRPRLKPPDPAAQPVAPPTLPLSPPPQQHSLPERARPRKTASTSKAERGESPPRERLIDSYFNSTAVRNHARPRPEGEEDAVGGGGGGEVGVEKVEGAEGEGEERRTSVLPKRKPMGREKSDGSIRADIDWIFKAVSALSLLGALGGGLGREGGTFPRSHASLATSARPAAKPPPRPT